MKRVSSLILGLFVLTVLMLSFQNFTATSTVVLLDLVSELRPQVMSKALPVFTDPSMRQGACWLNYDTAQVDAHAPTPMADAAIAAEFSDARWAISTWVKAATYPNACSDRAITYSKDSNSVLKVEGLDAATVSSSFLLYQNRLVLGARSHDFWQTALGASGPLFRSSLESAGGAAANASLTAKINASDLKPLTAYSAYHLYFDGALAYANINTGAVDYKGAVPAGAQLRYDPALHSSQLRLSLVLQWRLSDDQGIGRTIGLNAHTLSYLVCRLGVG